MLLEDAISIFIDFGRATRVGLREGQPRPRGDLPLIARRDRYRDRSARWGRPPGPTDDTPNPTVLLAAWLRSVASRPAGREPARRGSTTPELGRVFVWNRPGEGLRCDPERGVLPDVEFICATLRRGEFPVTRGSARRLARVMGRPEGVQRRSRPRPSHRVVDGGRPARGPRLRYPDVSRLTPVRGAHAGRTRAIPLPKTRRSSISRVASAGRKAPPRADLHVPR